MSTESTKSHLVVSTDQVKAPVDRHKHISFNLKVWVKAKSMDVAEERNAARNRDTAGARTNIITIPWVEGDRDDEVELKVQVFARDKNIGEQTLTPPLKSDDPPIKARNSAELFKILQEKSHHLWDMTYKWPVEGGLFITEKLSDHHKVKITVKKLFYDVKDVKAGKTAENVEMLSIHFFYDHPAKHKRSESSKAAAISAKSEEKCYDCLLDKIEEEKMLLHLEWRAAERLKLQEQGAHHHHHSRGPRHPRSDGHQRPYTKHNHPLNHSHPHPPGRLFPDHLDGRVVDNRAIDPYDTSDYGY